MRLERKEATVTLDVLGQVCPACLLVVLKEVNGLKESLRKGLVELVIWTDHRDSTRTVPESVRKMGYDVEVRKAEKFYEIVVSKKA